MQATKDPQAKVDFSLDWSQWLGADTITTSIWILPDPPDDLEIDKQSNTPTLVTVWLKGGLDGKVYRVVNRIETVGGRVDDRSLLLSVMNR